MGTIWPVARNKTNKSTCGKEIEMPINLYQLTCMNDASWGVFDASHCMQNKPGQKI